MIETDHPAPMWVILGKHNKALRLSFEGENRMRMVFRVFGAIATNEGWELFDGGEMEDLDEWQAAFWEIDGYLKWDGIFDWQTNPECMMHGFGIEHISEMQAVFSAVLHVGSRHFHQFDCEIPPLPEGAFEFTGTPVT
jgi:hypothetical protein